MIQQLLMELYAKHAKAHKYLYGFVRNGLVYWFIADSFVEYVRLDKASRGAGYSLRVKISAAQRKKAIQTGEAKVLCTKAEMLEKKGSLNWGECFEKLITEMYGKVYVRNRIGFDVAGDININGEEVQIKFENRATYANEKRLKKLG